MSNLGYAAQAVSRNWYIFPCNPAGSVDPESGASIEKMPHLIRNGRPYKLKWGEEATNSMQKVIEWWSISPNANIGLAVKPSRLLVIDLDTAKRQYALKGGIWGFLHDRLGPLVDGDDVLREMCSRFGGAGEYDRLMQTYRVCTASFGCHVYLNWPDGIQASQASPAPGAIDFRSNGGQKGGYVLAPGSSTTKGMYVVEHDAPILDATDFPWIVEMAREKPQQAKVKPLFSSGSGGGGYSGLVDSVKYAVEGNRNNCLVWAARSFCEDGASEEECIEHLLAPAVDGGQVERDVLATIRSAYRLQGSKA